MTSVAPQVPSERLPAPLPPEALGALTREIACFNHKLELLVAREHPAGRSPEDRRETWVLLSALTLVVIFCLVAFYLNQTEMREMQSGLQEDIDRAGHAAVSSLERAISSYHLERLPEAQAAVERLLRDKERRDGERYQEILGELQRQSDQAGRRLCEELRTIEEKLLGLLEFQSEFRTPKGDGEVAAVPAGRQAATELALQAPETGTGRAARAPDGARRESPPDPAARPPVPANPSATEKEEEKEPP